MEELLRGETRFREGEGDGCGGENGWQKLLHLLPPLQLLILLLLRLLVHQPLLLVLDL